MPGMRLLEREAALAALDEYAADACAGDGRLVLVAGEAGVGKTALVAALRERRPDARWLWGACEGSFTPRPLGPVYDVASQVGGSLKEACDVDASRQRIFRALLDELTSTDQPTVLCVEDVHWADEATLDLLVFLASRLRETHLMLVLTYRNDGLAPDHPLRMTMGELGAHSSTRRIDLPPLSRATVTALARTAGVAEDELYELTAGNPFLVTEVLEAGTQEIPPSVRDAVLARVARLPADARGALDACAVIGSRIDVRLLAEVAGCASTAIDACLTAGALVSDATGFRFRHEIARRAVEEAFPAPHRISLNARVLELLVAAGVEDAARLAHHADAARDGAAVLRFAPVAARQAASLGAHREATEQYRRALAYVDDRRPRAELLTAIGAECALTDQWQDAADVQEEALAHWQMLGDQLRVGDLQWRLARTQWRLCQGDAAMAMAEAAVATLEPLGPSGELGWAYAVLGAFRRQSSLDFAGQLTKAETLAEQFGDMSLLANVVDSIGCSKPGLDGVPYFRRALAIAQDAGDDAEAGRAMTNLQATFSNEYRLAEAEQVFVEGMRYCEVRDMSTYEHCLRGGHGDALNRMGRWDEVDELLTFDLSERELSPVNKISKLIVKGIIDTRRGRPGAAALLDEALAYVEAGFEPAYELIVGNVRLEAAWLAGDAEGMRREAQRAVPHADKQDAWEKGWLASWLRRCGLPPLDLDGVAPPWIALLTGDWRGAAETWHSLGAPYEEGLTLLDSADAEAMHEAVRIFERLGATATLARAQAIMRQHGVLAIPRGRRAQTRANRFGLTRREQEVLELVADGLTNAEISAKLFIAEKTVEAHVSSVLAKMNVESRRDAARLARQADVAAATI